MQGCFGAYNVGRTNPTTYLTRLNKVCTGDEISHGPGRLMFSIGQTDCARMLLWVNVSRRGVYLDLHTLPLLLGT